METIDKASQSAHQTVDKASQTAHQTVDKIAIATNQAAETLGQKREQLKFAEERMLKDCQEYIRAKPVTSMGIAVASGFLLSRLLR